MAQMRVYRFAALSSTTAGSGQMRVFRFEVQSGTSSGGNRMRVYRFDMLSSGTVGSAQMRVYRFEVLGSRGGFTYYDLATTTWLDVLSRSEYDTTTSAWRVLP